LIRRTCARIQNQSKCLESRAQRAFWLDCYFMNHTSLINVIRWRLHPALAQSCRAISDWRFIKGEFLGST
jgi:hypothetical protein